MSELATWDDLGALDVGAWNWVHSCILPQPFGQTEWHLVDGAWHQPLAVFRGKKKGCEKLSTCSMLETLWSAINYIFISGKGFSYDSWAVPFYPGCRNLQGHASGTRAILHSHGTFLGLILCWKMMIPCLWVHSLNDSFCYLGIIWSWLKSPGWEMTARERIC